MRDQSSQYCGQKRPYQWRVASVLLAVSVEGYSYAEAADLFRIPVGTVMSRIHRARRALGARIAEVEGVGQ